MCIVYLKNEGNYLLWLIPLWSLFKGTFCNLKSCHFLATWHSRRCVKHDVLSFSTRCKTVPYKLHPFPYEHFSPGWMIRPAEDAGQARHQPGWGLLSAAATATPMALTAASGLRWSQTPKEGRPICAKTSSLISLYCLCPIALNSAQHTQTQCSCCWCIWRGLLFFWATLQLHWVLGLPHGLVPVMCWGPQESALLTSVVPPGPAVSEVLHPSITGVTAAVASKASFKLLKFINSWVISAK